MRIYYNKKLKKYSQSLRSNATDAENLLWARLRKKQLSGVQFYRQKPIGNYIVDFFAPKVKLVVEVDGGQHFFAKNAQRDLLRDVYLSKLNLKVLRFNNLEVLWEIDEVVDKIFSCIMYEGV